MKTIDFSYFIERYNAGEMSDAEKEWFLKELDGNEILRKEINLRRNTDNVIKDQNIISLRNKLSTIERDRKSRVPGKTPKKGAYLKYAAFIAGLVIIGTITLFRGNNLDSKELMNRYYKPYEAPASQRSGNSELNPDFILALEFYNTRDYENAAKLFNRVIEFDSKNMQSVLLNGISNFEDKKYPEAKKSFVNVIEDNDNLFIETAKWYLALCYINTNEREKAKQYLELISKEGGIYSRDAKKIIRRFK